MKKGTFCFFTTVFIPVIPDYRVDGLIAALRKYKKKKKKKPCQLTVHFGYFIVVVWFEGLVSIIMTEPLLTFLHCRNNVLAGQLLYLLNHRGAAAVEFRGQF